MSKKFSKLDAIELCKKLKIDLNKNYFELSNSNVSDLLQIAKLYKYQKSKNSPKSTARSFFDMLYNFNKK
jgi:hypothetical protein